MSQGHTVLIGSAGSGTGFAAACALRRVWGGSLRIISMDSNPPYLCTTSLLSDDHEAVPPFGDPGYAHSLETVLKRHGVDTYLPLFPLEVVIAARFLERHPVVPYRSLVPRLKTAELCYDKFSLAGYLTEHAIPVPRTAAALAPFPGDLFFLKPASGVGSVGARRVTRAELLELPGNERAACVVQEVCTGPEITVDAFVGNPPGEPRTVCRERLETKAGVATKSRLFHSGQLNSLAGDLAGCLRLRGSFCFQTMQDSLGRTVVTDVNPRPGAATAASVAAGNDFFSAAFADAWGEDCDRFFTRLPSDVYVTRQYAEFVMNGTTGRKAT